jgi:hypothetical protein
MTPRIVPSGTRSETSATATTSPKLRRTWTSSTGKWAAPACGGAGIGGAASAGATGISAGTTGGSAGTAVDWGGAAAGGGGGGVVGRGASRDMLQSPM